MIKAIAIEVLYKLGRWAADLAFKYLRKWWEKHQAEERVDKEVESVKKAVKEADEALSKCLEKDEKECRVPSEEEAKLRESTRRLVDGLLNRTRMR